MNEQNNGLALVKEMFANIKESNSKEKNTNNDNKFTKDELLKKYFTPREDREIFRPIPPLKGRQHIETAYFHPVQVNVANGKKRWRKIYCPAHNDAKVPKLDDNGQPVLDSNGKPFLVPRKCPLCEKQKTILAKQDSSIKGIKKEDLNPEQKKIKENNNKIYSESLKWEAKKFYIMRGVDRNKTGDGVKFWRFKHNYKKQGVMDKLMPALEDFIESNNVDFADPYKGTDLSITVTDSELPNGSTYKSVATIIPKGSSKLYEDELVVKKWLSDDTTWRDVFKPASAPQLTPEEYLQRVARGTDPYWDDSDDNNKRWVFPDPRDEELQEKANNRDLGENNKNSQPKIEQASDIVASSYTNNIDIENVTSDDVGNFQDDAEEVGSEFNQESKRPLTPEQPKQTTTNVEEEVTSYDEDDSYGDDYDDLPF